ncbi:flippase [Pontibacter sp. G13]|uniref:flippase n=1 Tax=Pontibacter sp. G13 TaxID=3074898 RepID=UPI00288A286D|nr:flippase [Pontibacter sp. G13]WNJ19428.1 flippase [Pontibacter sp. G13]
MKYFQSLPFAQYGKNVFWMLGGRMIQLMITFWVTAMVGRYLGPESYGVLNYARSVAGFFLMVSVMGFESVLVRRFVDAPERTAETLGTSIWIRFLASLMSFGAVAAFAWLGEPDEITRWLMLILVAGGIFRVFENLDFFFQSQVQAQFGVKVRLLAVLGQSLFNIWLIYRQAPLIWFGVAFLIRHVIEQGGIVWMYRRHFGGLRRLSISKKAAGELLRETWPLLLSSLIAVLYMRMDQLMLRFLMDHSAVGYYAAALRFSEVWYFTAPLLTSALFPAIVKAKQVDQSTYRLKLQQLYTLAVLLALAIIVPTLFLGGWAIQLPFLFGASYAEAVPVLNIHIWTLVFVMLGSMVDKHLLMEGNQRFSFYRALVGLGVNIFLNLWLIPLWGITGAAVATLISQVVSSFLMMAIFPKTRTVFWMECKALIGAEISSLFRRGRAKLQGPSQ